MRVPPVSGQRATRGWRQLLLLAPLLLASACFLLPKAEYPVCTRPPTDEDTEAAQGAHKAATRLYDKESYERAIEAWLAAYELDCSAHGLLINIGRAHGKLGNDDEKLRALETYVARAGKDADMAIVEEVERLKAEKEGKEPVSEVDPYEGAEAEDAGPPPTVDAAPPQAAPPQG